MGQISLPVLNRTGYTMFWGSTWENTHNYQNNLKEDILLRMLIPSFFNKTVVNTSFFFNKNLFFKNSLLVNPEWSTNSLYLNLNSDFNDTILDKTNLPTYFNKIWILRFQNWVLIFLIFYKPSENTLNLDIFKNNNNNLEDTNLLNYSSESFNILSYYYIFLQQNLSLKTYYKNTNFNSFDF